MGGNLLSVCQDLKDRLMAFAWARIWVAAGSLAGFGAVAMAAVAAHALPQRLEPRALAAVHGAIQMQGWHALALVLTGFLVAGGGPALLANLAGGAFLLGMLLFCGSIYLADLAGIHLGPTAPAGGLLLMAGWLLLAASAIFAGKAL
jgi:uncharacterized membrane protein YgdD (TMEM256/DUF423 family)